jgi:hypothetical protein
MLEIGYRLAVFDLPIRGKSNTPGGIRTPNLWLRSRAGHKSKWLRKPWKTSGYYTICPFKATAAKLCGTLRESAGFDANANTVFAITDGANHLYTLTIPFGAFPNTPTLVSSGASALQISVGTDTAGANEVWFTDGTNTVWRLDQGNFTMTTATATQIAASQGQVFLLDKSHPDPGGDRCGRGNQHGRLRHGDLLDRRVQRRLLPRRHQSDLDVHGRGVSRTPAPSARG